MNYDEYVRIQTVEHGQVKKPHHYRVGERKAVDWFFKYEPLDARILDVGCGVGVEIRQLYNLNFDKIFGIELNPRKVEVCLRRGFDVVLGDAGLKQFESYGTLFDIVWSSHSFEHCLPKLTIDNLKYITRYDAKFFFVLPYPDLTPANAHCASKEIGLNIDDGGKTLIQWFEDQGLELIVKKFDTFREKEIWLKFRKNK